jgi:predicted Zn-dependent protease
MLTSLQGQLGELLDLVPFELVDIPIGRNAATTVEQELGPVLDDPALTLYVDSVGRKLVPYSDEPDLPYVFKVLDNDQVNAFALPGGNVYVTTGLLRALSNEAQLAAVLGHEMGHVTDRHGVKQLGAGTGAAILAEAALGKRLNQESIAMLSNLLLGGLAAGYSRHHEEKADAIGLDTAARAGYNPMGAVDVMRLFDRIDGEDPGLIESLFRTHPNSGERANELEHRVNSRYSAKGYTGEEAYQQAVYGRLPEPKFDPWSIGWVVAVGVGFAGLWWLFHTLNKEK